MDYRLNFDDAYIDGEYLFFSARDFNGFFRLKKGEKYAEWLGRFPGEAPWHKGLHFKIVEYGGKLFFTPFSGHGIHIYDLEKKDLRFYPLHGERTYSFSNAIEIDGKIYLIPLNLRTPFVVYDINSGNAWEDDGFWPYLRNSSGLNEKHFIGGFGCTAADEKIYITIVGLEAVICYDIRSKRLCLKKLGFMPRGIHYFDGLFYFTVVSSHKIVIYDEKKDTIKEVAPESGNGREWPVLSILKHHGRLFLMPGGSHTDIMAVSFSGENIEAESFPLIEAEQKIQYSNLYKNYRQKGSQVLFLPKAGNGILVFDLDQKTREVHRAECGSPYAEQCYVLSRYGGLYQEEELNLGMYMKLLQYDLGRPCHNADDKSAGQKILAICQGEEG